MCYKGANVADLSGLANRMNDAQPQPLASPHLDKTGAALDRQRFQMLEDIARELSGKPVFPTCFDPVIKLRKALDDPRIGLAEIADLLALEPLVSTRILALANSAAYRRDDREIRDLRTAVGRLGLNLVRTTALAIAMKQLMLMRDVVAFKEQTTRLWEHSLRTASAACILARELTRINPEEAMLAGMVHDIGAFYMIYRAAQYEELVLRPETTRHLVVRWHESIGHSLAIALGLPESIAAAMLDHDQYRPFPEPPRTLADIVYLANLIAGGRFEWLDMPPDTAAADVERLQALLERFQSAIDEHEAASRAILAD